MNLLNVADHPSMNATTASSIQQSQVQNDIAFAVARKSLDQTKAQGDAALSLLQSAANLQQDAQQQSTQRPLGPGQTINVVA